MNTNIVPDIITTQRTATSFTVRCLSLELFNTASFLAQLLDADGGVISTQVIHLTTEQYNEWYNNDQYIINLTAETLGVTVAP